MAFYTDLTERISAVRDLTGDVASADRLPAAIDGLTDGEALRLVAMATEAARLIEQVVTLGSGVIARRSDRTAGHDGLAQSQGHRNPVSLIQEITGTSRAEAARQVRVGEALLSAPEPEASEPDDSEPNTAADCSPPTPFAWDLPIRDALFAGTISTTQVDVIRRGLGGPRSEEFEEAWTVAAAQLIDEATDRTVEELARAARTVRDALDPEGALVRFEARHEARSFRMYTDADGMHRGHFVFDDEGAAWVRAINDAALRPRRGGPRFVDPDEKAQAAELATDPRTNDQLSYDLMIDVLRAGALADAKTVFGTRQAGVRLVHVAIEDSVSRALGGGVAHLEDDGTSVPGWLAEQHVCDTSTSTCTIDRDGNPLYLGREQRLFSARQRVALAIHMNLHHGGWRITRDGLGDFVLRARGSEAIILHPRLALKYAWHGVDPPPRRFRPAA